MSLVSLGEAVGGVKAVMRRQERDALLVPIMTRFAERIGRMWLAQGRIFLAEMKKRREQIPLAESANLDSVFEPIFRDVFVDTESFRRDLERHLIEAYGTGAVQAADKMGFTGSFDMKNHRAVRRIEEQGAKLITRVNSTTKARIQEIIADGAAEGKSYSYIARQIKGRFAEFAVPMPQKHIVNRATLVAVTEVGQAYMDGNNQVYDLFMRMGMPMVKRWDTMGDERVSDGCAANEEQGWLHYDDMFASGDPSPLRFPGCRCGIESEMYDPAVHGEELGQRFPGFGDQDWDHIYDRRKDDLAQALDAQGLKVDR